MKFFTLIQLIRKGNSETMIERNNITLERLLVEQNNLDREVQEHDPLGLDKFMVNKLHRLNNEGNVDAITQVLDQVTTRIEPLMHFTIRDALAATRDLGMIAASIVRHGTNLNTLPNLEYWLVCLSKITGEVPRDTVFSYGPRNCREERMRTFTGTPEERLFIKSFNQGMSKLGFCTLNLLKACEYSILEPEFAVLLGQTRCDFKSMVDTMVVVRKKITPKYFSNYLRPYFPPLTIDGKTYMAPGGAQMPLILIDKILWGSTSKDAVYHAYYKDNLQYLPSVYKYLAEMMRPIALVDAALNEVGVTNAHTSSTDRRHIIASLRATHELLTEIQKFRTPHLRTAEENFRIRPAFSLGSGGYTPEILERLSRNIFEAKNRITVALAEF